jgi:chaperone BCS1
MTTNHPEKLDAALIRPGRVDKQVEFKNTTREETKRMFVRMYTNDLPKEVANPTANEAANGPPNTGAALNSVVEHSKEEKPKEELSNELIQIAEDFASKVPEGEFSPAQIQGYLLMRKNDPRKAQGEVETWVESMKEAKEKGSKLLQVQ